jgi:hypothetical protein
MPPPTRERYNSKARGKGDSGRSHKIGKRKKLSDAPVEEKTGQPHHEPGMSAKKRKRVDSYIVSKSAQRVLY